MKGLPADPREEAVEAGVVVRQRQSEQGGFVPPLATTSARRLSFLIGGNTASQRSSAGSGSWSKPVTRQSRPLNASPFPCSRRDTFRSTNVSPADSSCSTTSNCPPLARFPFRSSSVSSAQPLRRLAVNAQVPLGPWGRPGLRARWVPGIRNE